MLTLDTVNLLCILLDILWPGLRSVHTHFDKIADNRRIPMPAYNLCPIGKGILGRAKNTRNKELKLDT